MGRITKINGMNYIVGNQNCDYDVQLGSAYQQCVNKLGQLEDLMEKYSIPNVAYLEKCIQKHDELGEIEEELGCPIELYYKMCIKGTELYSLPHSDVIQWRHQYIYHKDFEGNAVFCLMINSTLTPLYYVKDYGKTWALTKEELENDK